MDREDFVKKIVDRVRESAIDAMETNLKKPSGRNPDKKLIEMSKWYNQLSHKDRDTLKNVLTDSIDEAIFGFFCVLDGVRNIGIEGSIELVLSNSDKAQIINQGDIDLHDIYNDLVNH